MFTAFFFLSLLLVRSQKKGSFLGNLSSGLQDYFFIQLILGLSFLAPVGYEKFFFSILSLAYFTLMFLDLQISRIYKRGLIWSDFQWFEKSLWSLKDSVFYEIGFRGLGQLFTLLILWGSTTFFALKLFHPLLLLASAGSLWFHTHLFFRFFPKKINKNPPPTTSSFPSFFLFESEKSVFIDPFYPFLRKTTGYSSPSLFSLKKEKPHIVVLVLESLGMRDLDSAPFLKKISNKGVFFDQFYANFPISCPAAVSTLFGIPPFQENFHYHSLNDLPLTGMPQMLKKLGYYTAHFTSTYGEAKKEYLGDGEVFDRYTNRVNYIEQAKGKFFSSYMVDDQLAYQDLIEQMDQKATAESPFFGFLSSGFGHHPWDVPKEEEQGEKEGLKKLRQALRVGDKRLEEFFLKAQERPWYKDTLFILLGDHGQPMGEHENLQIRMKVYQENVHVPCVFLKIGDLEPQKHSFIASQIDIFPTVIDLLKKPVVHHSLGYPLSRKKEQRFQILGNLGFSTDIALREGPYKITPDEVFHIEDDPLEQNPLELVTPSAFQPLKEKLTQGFLIIDRMNSLKLWAPCKGEKLSLFAHQRESELLETLKKHPQPKDLEWMGNLANFFPPAFLLKKLSSLVSLKIKDSLLDPDVFLALIKNNRLKKLVLENVYGIDSCFQQLQNLDSLEILHLCGVDIEEKTLLDLIKKNPLNELSFTTIHVDPSRLFSVLQKKELRSLCIDLPVENAHLALLDNNRHLQSLSLRDASKIDLCGLLFLQNKPLSELEIIGLKKWDVSYVYFLQKLPLVFFSLEAEDFTDGDLISLLDLSLTHVKIRHCPNISEKGIIEFSEKAKSQIEIIYGHRISFNTKYFKLKSYTKGGFYEFIPKDYAYF